jgi:hypothetical protein
MRAASSSKALRRTRWPHVLSNRAKSAPARATRSSSVPSSEEAPKSSVAA